MKYENVLMMDTSSIKFGFGATAEIGCDMAALGCKRVLVLVDPSLDHSAVTETVLNSLKAEGIDAVLFDRIEIEPTDESFKQAIAFAQQGNFDGYVPVGGGSTMDTAKAANLYATWPADFLTYVNAPLGKGIPVPGRIKPMIAIPTTAGTGSETTGTAICDLSDLHVKTGIAHRYLRPLMGIVDPENTRSLPKMVTACSGLDVLCHAMESLTALPFTKRPAPEHPRMRPAYQGANEISQVWATQAIRMCAEYLPRAVADPDDDEARSKMLLAASFAGIGFGNAGVTIPHGMSYPVAGMAHSRGYHADGYPTSHAMVPHGMAVILNAPAAFRFTAPTNPGLHLYAAELMGADTRDVAPEDAGPFLSKVIVDFIRSMGIPNGLRAVGYGTQDIEDLVQGTLPQKRVLNISPRPVTPEDLAQLFLESLVLWEEKR